MRISKGGKERKNVFAQIIRVSRFVGIFAAKSVLQYHPYHKYSSISIPITSTAMKGFSSQMNTKTFGEVDVISQSVSARREVYEFIIALF